MSFRFRIMLFTIVLIAFLFSIGGAVLVHTTFLASLQKEEQAAIDSNRMVLRLLQIIGEEEEWFDEKDVVSMIQNIVVQDLTEAVQLSHGEETLFQKGVIGEDGIEIAQGSGSTSLFAQSEQVDENSKIYITYFKTENDAPYLQTTTPINLNGEVYVLRMGQDLTDIYRVRQQQIMVFQRTFWILLLCGAFISWLLATLLTAPLRKLSKASREIASGNLSYRSEINSNDEIGSLSRDFDRMADKLEKNIHLLEETAKQKERFMGAFTHEMKTPMTSIIGYADLLRSQKLNKRDAEDALDYIYTEAKRLENLSLKMLDLFVVDKMNPDMKPCSLSKLVLYVTGHLQGIFEKSNVKIVTCVESGTCIMDPDLVQTLLVNLLDNARKSMDGGGTIYVSAKMLNAGCRITVRDEGRGIPEDALKHLTEEFYRVDKARARATGSAGIGLALCDKIVKLHSGSMKFDSQEGIGTTVTVELKGGI